MAADFEMQDATPEEEEAKDNVVEEVLQALYKPQMIKSMLSTSQQSENPMEAIAGVIVQAIQTLDGALDNSIPDEIIIPAAVEIAAGVMDILVQAGLVQEGDEAAFESLQQYVVREAMEQYGDEEGLAQMQGMAQSSPMSTPQGAMNG